ncbi:hypothetical protein CKN86_02275 [Carnobacterium divergens]|uniref:hypothetical protein n=1 Tax=Carnobacterium divergens TaxID=2748 RepID=UPI000D462755|nr:hypothetical protein [Carnobacterium divergens]MCO6018259.1 hypothetical protein [Carnobacterium divergens]TFI64614.1 hypothetical protein CKN62_02275 [Carnobacterium divergens]TFI91483.1 hypothetical protein CKN84_02275 [Carnobacterium divergens]TFJ06539.1 hypothetical protein CKN86_02275 [Carnobacterium divergens]TFJ07892.1 hypothetical protein CKN65_02280 [Carnobacterium divergens]
MIKDLLIKFIDEEYIEDYLNKGKIFFPLNKHFVDMENESNVNKHIADSLEGVRYEAFDPKEVILMIGLEGCKDEDMQVFKYKRAALKEKNEALLAIPIACFVLISESDYIENPDGTFNISENVIKELEGISNDRPFVISFADSFLEKVNYHAIKNGIPLKHGPINYYDEKTDENLTRSEFELNPVSALMHKQQKYSDQREYRIIYNEVSENPKGIEIGDINEFSTKFNSLSELEQIRLKVVPLEDLPYDNHQ